jgi:hypothetical protein
VGGDVLLSRAEFSEVVGRISMGVGEATGVVWDIWAVMAEAVVGDGMGVLAVWARADIVQIRIERMVQRMLDGWVD